VNINIEKSSQDYEGYFFHKLRSASVSSGQLWRFMDVGYVISIHDSAGSSRLARTAIGVPKERRERSGESMTSSCRLYIQW